MNRLYLFFFFFALSSSIFATENLKLDAASSNQGINLGTAITSDKLEISFNNNQTEFSFTGNVKLNSSEFSAECVAAKIIILGNLTSLPSGSGLESLSKYIKKISLEGPVDIKYDKRSGSADYVEITPDDSTIILFGKATVNDTMATIYGNKICLNYKTQSIVISSDSNDKPVTLKTVNIAEISANPPDKKNTSKEINVLQSNDKDIKNTSILPILNEKSHIQDSLSIVDFPNDP